MVTSYLNYTESAYLSLVLPNAFIATRSTTLTHNIRSNDYHDLDIEIDSPFFEITKKLAKC